MQIKKRVGANVRAAREALGMTQMQFAERLKTRPGDVSRWENGKVVPSLTTLSAIGELAGRDVVWFYSAHDDDPTTTAAVA